MKARVYLGVFILLFAFALTGCKGNENQIEKEGLTYSNLVDADTQQEVAAQLKKAGVSEERTEEFIKWVNEFNDNVKNAASYQNGFTYIKDEQIDYSGIELLKEFEEDGSQIIDENCRLTAFLLFEQFIEAKNLTSEYDPYLMFDIEAVEEEERFQLFRDNVDKFVTMFNPVKVDKDNSLEDDMKAIKNAWNERGIKLTNGKEISLITLYLHDNLDSENNLRFVGHTGVLLEEGGQLMFIEKYGWLTPFQVTKFADQDALVKYLLGRGDLVGDGTERDVIVMKNDKVISKTK